MALAPFVVPLVESLSALGAKDAADEATKYYGDLKQLPQPPPNSLPSPPPNHNLNNSNNNINVNKREPPDSPPHAERNKKPKVEPPPDSKSPPPVPSPSFSVPPAPEPIAQLPAAEQLQILSLLAGLPTDLIVKLVFEGMSAVPNPPPNTPIPSNIADLFRV